MSTVLNEQSSSGALLDQTKVMPIKVQLRTSMLLRNAHEPVTIATKSLKRERACCSALAGFLDCS
jgi:hypothetical protein